jgi:hypothetical protein
MPKIAPLAVLTMLSALFLGAEPAMTAPAKNKEAAAQSQPRVRTQVRTQVRVTPRYPYRTYHSLYPVPYKYEYPGPNGVRRCVDRYVVERRPAGTVVVPRTNCVWVVRR